MSKIGVDFIKKEKTGPCQNHDKETELAEAKERLNKVSRVFESGAKKNDANKPEYSNIPRLALLEVAKVMTYGAKEYGKYNYSGKITSSRLTDALERHLNKYLVNEDYDESSYHHIAHVAANALMLLDNILLNKLDDNRNKAYIVKNK